MARVPPVLALVQTRVSPVLGSARARVSPVLAQIQGRVSPAVAPTRVSPVIAQAMARVASVLGSALGLALVVLLASAPAFASSASCSPGAAPPPDDLGLAVLAARERLGAVDLWPGFSPLDHPLAIFDGQRTLLAGHPGRPEGFRPLPDQPGLQVHEGRHPSVTANTSIDLAGVRSATVLVSTDPARESDPAGGSHPTRGPDPAELAAVAAHEAFHVHQDRHHPGWTADESQLFLLPVDDAALLSLRRLESRAWRQALLADDGAGHAALALDLRRQRDELRSDGAAGYERDLERREGLAEYVQRRALPDPAPRLPPEGGWPAEDDRERAYVTGAAIGFLLDRFAPDWRQRLEEDDGAWPDQLLAEALQQRGATPAAIPDALRSELRAVAERDARAVREARAGTRQAFLTAEGHSLLVVVVSGPVLSPQGFDPLNVQGLGDNAVLHSRYLVLERPGGDRIEVLGRGALTTGAGSHPLFGGVRELAITGLPEAPALTWDGDQVTITADGVESRFVGATVATEGRVVVVQLR